MTCPVLIVSTRTTSNPCMTNTSRLTLTACTGVTCFLACPGGSPFDAPRPLPCATAGETTALSTRNVATADRYQRNRSASAGVDMRESSNRVGEVGALVVDDRRRGATGGLPLRTAEHENMSSSRRIDEADRGLVVDVVAKQRADGVGTGGTVPAAHRPVGVDLAVRIFARSRLTGVHARRREEVA